MSGLAALIERGAIDPADIVCLLGKTEGNGCVNDWSRGFATSAYQRLLATRLGRAEDEVAAGVLFIMSGGTEGILTPHMNVFVRREVGVAAASGAAAGGGHRAHAFLSAGRDRHDGAGAHGGGGRAPGDGVGGNR